MGGSTAALPPLVVSPPLLLLPLLPLPPLLLLPLDAAVPDAVLSSEAGQRVVKVAPASRHMPR